MADVHPTFRFLLRLALLGGWPVLGCEPARDSLFDVARESQGVAGTASGQTPSSNPSAGSGATKLDAGGVRDADAGDAAVAIDPRLNPDASFVWTETPPGKGGACQPDTFAGNFSCELSNVLLSSHVEGFMTLTLDGSAESQRLTVTSSQLIAFADDGTTFLEAELNGQLDCSARALSGTVQPTMTEVLPLTRQLIWVTSTNPMVTGTIDGSFDPSMQTIKVDLTFGFDTGQECTTSFSIAG
jgi:hypothetical protein